MSTPPADLVAAELFSNRFSAIAREMGEVLRRTALSTNVKERLDFSCAVLDPEGRLVVNAPHIPVHLGALGACVRQVTAALPCEPGDVVLTNHPGFGGSHLPDVTVITPVHDEDEELLGYVANRAHHAEIGGTRPGSMPPDAASLGEEGVVIPPTYLIRRGEPCWDLVQHLLEDAPWPSRSVAENLADLRAAQASNHRGARALRGLASTYGTGEVRAHMAGLYARAAATATRALEARRGRYSASERLDDGGLIHVRIEVGEGRARFDFAGTSPVRPGNLNAPRSVTRSAVLYVLRLLIDEPLPLNEGLLEPVTIDIPTGMLNPEFGEDEMNCPAVVGGNVETSQRVVDTLIKALGLAACSQGTMNNTLFGTARFGYYETVCGGCGAGPGFDGASAVHSHMTNTRITDPEVLEQRYPVRLERFAIRQGSGGVGEYRGGDGVVRELVFLEPMALSMLTQHRAFGPFGARGGNDGLPGRQRLIRRDGSVDELAWAAQEDVEPGDRLILETPGGGGWGAPPK